MQQKLKLEYKSLKLEQELQIVQAEVIVEADEETVVDESMCVDVGLPALLLSCFEPTFPNRWAPVDEWQSIPFFVCGCGDPECRGISFRTRLLNDEREIEWVLVEQAEDQSYREQETFVFELHSYKEQVLRAADQFLEVINKADYQPLMKATEEIVRQLADRIRHSLSR
jgi:hypothetical protein